MSVDKKNQLVFYLNEVLYKVGAPDEIREYLIDISRRKLTNINEKDILEKKALLKINLYILLINLASKKPLLVGEAREDFPAAEHFLSEDHLRFLKSKKTFEDVDMIRVQAIFKRLCPIWPWC